MKSDSTRSRHGRWSVSLAGLTAMAGLCLSVYLQSRIAQTEATAARLTAETLRLNTEQEMNLFVEVLESVCALHAFSDEVNQAAMDEFVEKGLIHQRAVLGAFGLTQQISPWLRAVLEEQKKAHPETGYRFLQQGPDGTWVPDEPRNVYYPLTWQNRTEALNIPIGFDFASLSETRPAIERIEQTRRTALVESPIINQESGGKGQKSRDRGLESEIATRHPSPDTFPSPSYWVFAPVVMRQAEDNPLYAPGAVIGFAVAVLHPETILQRVAARSSVSSPGLRLNLMIPPDPNAKETIRLVNGAWLYRYPLEAIDSQWIFECSLPITVTGHRSAATLAAGLLITALMTSLLLILGGMTKKIEDTVRSRTKDLRIANARLEKSFHERAHLEAEMNELAARERRRMGRDLHDSLGQKLTGAVFLSRSLLDYFSNSKNQESGGRSQESGVSNPQSSIPNPQSTIENQEAHARTLNETLKSAVAQVRNMARGLAPVTLNDESLGEALDQLAEEMTGLYGVSCEVTGCAGLPALDRKTKEQLYLIAREAVNNAARHAQASRVTIRLDGDEAGWTLCVEDDGKGLPKTPPAAEGLPCSVPEALLQGMGIRIMRHRAGLIGAGFTMTSAPGRGTRVEITSE